MEPEFWLCQIIKWPSEPGQLAQKNAYHIISIIKNLHDFPIVIVSRNFFQSWLPAGACANVNFSRFLFLQFAWIWFRKSARRVSARLDGAFKPGKKLGFIVLVDVRVPLRQWRAGSTSLFKRRGFWKSFWTDPLKLMSPVRRICFWTVRTARCFFRLAVAKTKRRRFTREM